MLWSWRYCRGLVVVFFDAVHGLVVETKIVAELVDHRFPYDLGHLFLIRGVFFDRSLVDGHDIGQHVAVRGIAPCEVDTTIETIERVGRLDAHLRKRLLVRPVLDDHRDVLDLVFEFPRQAPQRSLHQGFELASCHSRVARSRFCQRALARSATAPPATPRIHGSVFIAAARDSGRRLPSGAHNPRTRSTLITSGTSRIAAMMSCSWLRSATSTTKLLMPRRSSVTVTSALVMLPFLPPMAPVISESSPGRSLPM